MSFWTCFWAGVRGVLLWCITICGILLGVFAVLFLWRFGIFRWIGSGIIVIITLGVLVLGLATYGEERLRLESLRKESTDQNT